MSSFSSSKYVDSPIIPEYQFIILALSSHPAFHRCYLLLPRLERNVYRWTWGFRSFLPSLLWVYMRSSVWRRYRVSSELALYEVFRTFFVPTYSRTVIKSDSRVPPSVAIMLMVLGGDRMTQMKETTSYSQASTP